MPLNVDSSVRIGTLPEGGGKLIAGILWNLTDDTQPWSGTVIIQENCSTASRHDDRSTDEANVTRTDKVIAPRHSIVVAC
jgi:hypothetical protein